MKIRRNYTKINVVLKDKAGKPAPAGKPAILNQYQSGTEKEERIYLVDKKLGDREVKQKQTDITMPMLKKFVEEGGTDLDNDIEVRYFWKQAIGGEKIDVDKITDKELRAMSNFLLQANDIGVIKSIVEKVKGEGGDLKKVFNSLAEKIVKLKESISYADKNAVIESLLANVEFTKLDKVVDLLINNEALFNKEKLNIEVLNAMLASPDPVATIEGVVANPSLFKLEVDIQNAIIALFKPEEMKVIIDLIQGNREILKEGKLLKSIFGLGKLEDVKTALELLARPSVLTSANHVGIMEAIVERPNVLKLGVEVLSKVIRLENSIEIIKALDEGKDLTEEGLEVLNQILASGRNGGEVPSRLSETKMRNLSTSSDFGKMLNVMGEALKEVVKGILNVDVIKIILNNIDPIGRLTALMEDLRKAKLERLEHGFVRFNPEGFGREIFEALSKESDVENTDLALKEGGKVANLFYMDVNRLPMNLGGDDPLWNDKNNEKDPFFDYTEITAADTPPWKKERIKEIQDEFGYIEGVDSEENREALQKVKDKITEMQHEWRERRIKELLEFCGYIEGGNEEDNRKAEKKAFMISKNCSQNMGNLWNRANYESKDGPLGSGVGSKIQLPDDIVDLTFSLTKNENGDILLCGFINAPVINRIQEFTATEMKYKECDPEVSFARIEVGIVITDEGEFEQYNGGSAEYVLGVKGNLDTFARARNA